MSERREPARSSGLGPASSERGPSGPAPQAPRAGGRTASQIVTDFVHALEQREIDTAVALAADDIEYHNIPMPKVIGADAVREFLEGFLAGAEELEWVVHHQLADGDLVMNERTDRFKMGGRWLELPVVGVFEVKDGKIASWRDYFDLQMFMSQMEAPPEPA